MGCCECGNEHDSGRLLHRLNNNSVFKNDSVALCNIKKLRLHFNHSVVNIEIVFGTDFFAQYCSEVETNCNLINKVDYGDYFNIGFQLLLEMYANFCMKKVKR